MCSASEGFYFQASNGSVALPVAGYNYSSDWTPLLAGLAPAGMAASLAAPDPYMQLSRIRLLPRVKKLNSRQVAGVAQTTATYAEYYLNPFKAAAASFAVEAIVAPVRATRPSLNPSLPPRLASPNGGLIVMPDSFMINRRHRTPRADNYRGYHFRRTAGRRRP